MKKLFSLLLLSTMLLAACQPADTPDNTDTETGADTGSDMDTGNDTGSDMDTNTDGDSSSNEDGDSELVVYGVAGNITSINVAEDNDQGVLGTISVEGPENNGADYQSAVVTVTEDTIIYISDKVTFEDLAEGQYVNVFIEDEVRESFPVQVTATQINIIPEDPIQLELDDLDDAKEIEEQ